eukprot:6010543-Heterocapsa_arctica.AAC.1
MPCTTAGNLPMQQGGCERGPAGDSTNSMPLSMACDTTPGQALSKDTAWPGRKPNSPSSKNATAHKIG